MNISSETIVERLRETLYKVNHPEYDFPVELIKFPTKSAAVLIPLFRYEGNLNVLFIRRTVDLTEHSGQVAFPGGRADFEGEDPETIALREAQEEIGLNPSDLKILGRMNLYITITNYAIVPIVAEIPFPYRFKLQEKEVARIFYIPLDWLSNPANREERKRYLPEPYDPIRVIYYKPYDGEVLWGVTARIMLSLIEILTSQ